MIVRQVSPRKPTQFVLVGTVLLYAALLFGAPILAIVQGALASGVSRVVEAITQPDVLQAFQLTFFLAAGSVIVNTLAGVIVAWVLVRHQFRGKRVIDALVDAPFAFSPVIAGYVLIMLFGRNGWIPPAAIQIAFSWPGMLLATIFVSLPFVIRELQPVLAELPQEPEQAALTLGAGRLTVFRRIILPQIWRSLLYGIVLTFARSVGEFGAVAVVGGSIEKLTETATIFVFRAIQDRNPFGAYSVSIILGLLSVAILVFMGLLRRRTDAKSEVF